MVGNNHGKNVYSICWDMIGIPEIELHIYTEAEADVMRRNGNSFLKEVEKSGVMLIATQTG